MIFNIAFTTSKQGNKKKPTNDINSILKLTNAQRNMQDKKAPEILNVEAP